MSQFSYFSQGSTALAPPSCSSLAGRPARPGPFRAPSPVRARVPRHRHSLTACPKPPLKPLDSTPPRTPRSGNCWAVGSFHQLVYRRAARPDRALNWIIQAGASCPAVRVDIKRGRVGVDECCCAGCGGRGSDEIWASGPGGPRGPVDRRSRSSRCQGRMGGRRIGTHCTWPGFTGPSPPPRACAGALRRTMIDLCRAKSCPRPRSPRLARNFRVFCPLEKDTKRGERRARSSFASLFHSFIFPASHLLIHCRFPATFPITPFPPPRARRALLSPSPRAPCTLPAPRAVH